MSTDPDPIPVKLAYIASPGVLCVVHADGSLVRYQLTDEQILNILADTAALVAGRHD